MSQKTFSVLALNEHSAEVLVIVEKESFEYCSSLCMELFQKSSLNYRIVDLSNNTTVVFYSR